MAEMRRCGAHQVILPDGSILQQAVVEIQEGRVVNYFEFREEFADDRMVRRRNPGGTR